MRTYKIGDVVDFVSLIDRAPSLAFPEVEDPQWFCAVTNPGCWKRAELELYSLGYRTFLPKVKRWATHARVRKATERPLLGRYLFVEVDHPRQSYDSVRRVNGIESWVAHSGDPIRIPTFWVENFIMRYLAGEWDYVTSEPCRYMDENGVRQFRMNDQISIGARVRLMDGEFNDMLATVTGRENGKLTFKVLDSNKYGRVHESSVRAA